MQITPALFAALAVLLGEDFTTTSTLSDAMELAAELEVEEGLRIAIRNEKVRLERLVRLQTKARRSAQYSWESIVAVHHGGFTVEYLGHKVLVPFVRSSADWSCQCLGLVQQMALEMGEATTPVVRIENAQCALPDEDGNDVQADIPEEMLAAMSDDYTLVEDRMGFYKQSVVHQVLLEAFPKAIDYKAYSRGCGAPAIPFGYIPNAPVVIKRFDVTAPKVVELDGHGEKIVGAVTMDSGVDGSGRYHPQHPALREAVQEYSSIHKGFPIFQIRALNEDGWFAKGIIVPDENCVDKDGNPIILIDYRQVKGSKKGLAKRIGESGSSMDINLNIALLNTSFWDGKMASCFELLECMNRTPETEAAVDLYVEREMEKLMRRGMWGLLAESCAQNPTIARVVEILRRAEELGHPINPMAIPMLAAAAKEALGKRLWQIAQGALGKGATRWLVIDNSIPDGYVVCSDYKVGEEVYVNRFPLISPQGLVRATVMQPLHHHTQTIVWTDAEGKRHIKRRLPANVLFANDNTICTMMQGDDDGDMVTVRTGERAKLLWESRYTEQVYHFEQSGQKLDIMTDSDDGLDYLRKDTMGPVGLFTIHRAELLALGDEDGARALSLMIQMAVDSAKKIMKLPDYRAAVDLRNWDKKEDGSYGWSRYITIHNEEWIKDYQRWYSGRLKWLGWDKKEMGSPLTWKAQHNGKSIDPSTWSECQGFLPNGQRFEGNLVHYAHDKAFVTYEMVVGDKFEASEEDMPLEYLLSELLNIPVPDPEMVWGEYAGRSDSLRARSQVKEIGRLFAKARESSDEESQLMAFAAWKVEDTAEKLTTEELVQIWYMECGEDWFAFEANGVIYYTMCEETANEHGGSKANKPSHAVRLAMADTSPVPALLNLQETTCQWLSLNNWVEKNGRDVNLGEARRNWVVDRCMSSSNPIAALNKVFQADTGHMKSCTDENGTPIPLSNCPHCTKTLLQLVVRKMRATRGNTAKEQVAALVAGVNRDDRRKQESLREAQDIFEASSEELRNTLSEFSRQEQLRNPWLGLIRQVLKVRKKVHG